MNVSQQMVLLDGVWVFNNSLQSFRNFEDAYIKLRKKEDRIFTIEQIRQLPKVPKNYIHRTEWQIRSNTIYHVLRYLQKTQKNRHSILDIGCGNGFFTNMISKYFDMAIGVDVNLMELKQAAEAFVDNKAIKWYCLDIFKNDSLETASFDLITFCCSFQYFENAERIINKCFDYLNDEGRILIIDSPFYKEEETDQAKKRTTEYYTQLDAAWLSDHYFHHSWEELRNYKYNLVFSKNTILDKILNRYMSPFPCIEIVK